MLLCQMLHVAIYLRLYPDDTGHKQDLPEKKKTTASQVCGVSITESLVGPM